MTAVFDDLGIRFEYPADWELDVADDGPRATVSVQSPDGLAYAMIVLDEDRPAPAEQADEALDAMRGEYPDLDAAPALESIDGQRAVGYDLEFFSLDAINSATIRCLRTPRRTIFCLGQWSDLGDEENEVRLRLVRSSLEETDAT